MKDSINEENNFQMICRQDTLLLSKNKNKPSNSILRYLSKIKINEIVNFLENNHDILNNNYLKKSSLHWACDNNKPQVLFTLIEYFINQNWNIFMCCPIESKNVNISEYCLMKCYNKQFIIASSFGIKPYLEDVPIQDISIYGNDKAFLKLFFKNLQNYNSTKYNSLVNNIPFHWRKNPLNTAFWNQNKDLIDFILTHDFIEKKDWIKQLEEEIYYINHYEDAKNYVYDATIFYLADYLSFSHILKIITDGLKLSVRNDFSQYTYVANCLYYYFDSRINNNDFDEFTSCFSKNENIDMWRFIYQHLADNNLINNKWNNLTAINKICFSYILNESLEEADNKIKTINKI